MDGTDDRDADDPSSATLRTPPGARNRDSVGNVSNSGGRTRSTRRKYVAESETLSSIAQDAEERLAAKRKDRAKMRELRLKEIQRKQQLEDAKEILVNGDGQAAASTPSPQEPPSVRVDDDDTEPTTIRPQSATPLAAVANHVPSRSGADERASGRDPTSASHLLEPRASSLPRVKGLNQRRGSGDGASSSADEESRSVSLTQFRDVKKALADSEEKVKNLMMRNQHLDNEKTSLNYTVDLLQDKFEELSERSVECERLLKSKSHQLDASRRENKQLNNNVAVLRQQLQQREDLVHQHGLVLVGGEVVEDRVHAEGANEGDYAVDGGADDDVVVKRRLAPAAIVTRHAAALLDNSAGAEGTLDFRLRRFAAEKEELRETIKILQAELEAVGNAEPSSANTSGLNRSSVVNAMDELEMMTREERKKLEECRIKLEKTEIELMTADSAILRMEQQVKRYKEMLDVSERQEEELKADKRKMTRELREAKGQVEELTNANKHLQTRLDKIRAVRGVLQTELNKPL